MKTPGRILGAIFVACAACGGSPIQEPAPMSPKVMIINGQGYRVRVDAASSLSVQAVAAALPAVDPSYIAFQAGVQHPGPADATSLDVVLTLTPATGARGQMPADDRLSCEHLCDQVVCLAPCRPLPLPSSSPDDPSSG